MSVIFIQSILKVNEGFTNPSYSFKFQDYKKRPAYFEFRLYILYMDVVGNSQYKIKYMQR
jgi:hypothetical protein